MRHKTLRDAFESAKDGFNLANEIFNFVGKEFKMKKPIEKEKYVDLVQCNFCEKFFPASSTHYCHGIRNA